MFEERRELDDVLGQMSAELSALHVFVYGGEYNDPMHGNKKLGKMHEVASLGITVERSLEYNGYIITSIAHPDPDFDIVDGSKIYSPLSHEVLRLSGQIGPKIGDVIVGVNGESTIKVMDLHVLLRGMAGRSVRLDVIRRSLANKGTKSFLPEPIIAVPISLEDADNLRYAAWEWKTLQLAERLASGKGFTVGYIHLQSMEGPADIDAFTRGFFSNYNKDALIIDVRHNLGGNIDSWLLDVLQRRPWMYWQGRATNPENGGLGWDQQFAFRGHLVVLINEKSSSDAEGFARGVSELGLGKLVGTRTWGGGIWLSSDNTLVDGGIATAPEIGTYNDNFGWGLGIEQQGVIPDIVVDNNPRDCFHGRDQQLEKAINVLAEWLVKEPVVLPKSPPSKANLSLKKDLENCAA
jgi:tricorn protease